VACLEAENARADSGRTDAAADEALEDAAENRTKR
jgi:hypothetical protein